MPLNSLDKLKKKGSFILPWQEQDVLERGIEFNPEKEVVENERSLKRKLAFNYV